MERGVIFEELLLGSRFLLDVFWGEKCLGGVLRGVFFQLLFRRRGGFLIDNCMGGVF